MPRIVSLSPSATEIVCALHLDDQLVGRTHECDYPAECLQPIPICTEPKLAVVGSGYGLHQRARAVLQEEVCLYRVDAHLLADLRPDFVVTQYSSVGSNLTLTDLRHAFLEVLHTEAELFLLQPAALSDIWREMHLLAERLGVEQRGLELVYGLQQRAAAILRQAAREIDRPRVAVIESLEPLRSGGRWVPELVEMAGGKNLFGSAGRPGQALTDAQVVDANPDIVVFAPLPAHDHAPARRDADIEEKLERWAAVRAVRRHRVYSVDAGPYLGRSGPRLVEGLEILAEIIHPFEFHFGHQGRGWAYL